MVENVLYIYAEVCKSWYATSEHGGWRNVQYIISARNIRIQVPNKYVTEERFCIVTFKNHQ